MKHDDPEVVEALADALWLSRVTKNSRSVEEWQDLWAELKTLQREEQRRLLPQVTALIEKTERRKVPRD